MTKLTKSITCPVLAKGQPILEPTKAAFDEEWRGNGSLGR
jgi:hypothetical protein